MWRDSLAPPAQRRSRDISSRSRTSLAPGTSTAGRLCETMQRSRWATNDVGFRRERRAAARRHKNPLRIHRASVDDLERFEEVVVVLPSGPANPLQREALTRGQRQVIVVGSEPADLIHVKHGRVKTATLDLKMFE